MHYGSLLNMLHIFFKLLNVDRWKDVNTKRIGGPFLHVNDVGIVLLKI